MSDDEQRMCSSCGKLPAVGAVRYREGTKYLCRDCMPPPAEPLKPLRPEKHRRRAKRSTTDE